MITKKEIQRLHDRLEEDVRLKHKLFGDYEGFAQDLIALNNYKEQLRD